jgi:5,10-methylenetetrahydrofolate reductase
MIQRATSLQERVEAGQPILVAEISPPQGCDPTPLREAAKRYAGKIHALGVSDNRDRVAMSALAAASLIAAEGIEPILHVTTRDRNRIALVSEALGAQALGIFNLLCTSGSHQTDRKSVV